MPSLRPTAICYRIGQLTRLFGVTPRALRFYEQIGLLQPVRDGPNRVYSRGDYQRLRIITSGRKAGLSLEHIRELLDLYDPADGGEAQIGKAIERLRQRIADLEAQRGFLAQSLDELELRLERMRSDRPDDRQKTVVPPPASDESPRRATR